MKIKEEEIIRLMSGEKSREKGVRLMMDAYQSRLYWHIRRIIVDHDLSQDVLQETFIKAYQNFHQFKQDSQLYTWLYRIATNESLQQLNKLKKMQNIISRIWLQITYLQKPTRFRFYCRKRSIPCQKSRNSSSI